MGPRRKAEYGANLNVSGEDIQKMNTTRQHGCLKRPFA
jgi:hypothetical protein